MDGTTLRQAARSCLTFLQQTVDDGGTDWRAGIPGMEWSVGRVVGHMAETLLYYAADLSAGPNELRALTITVPDDTATPTDLLAVLRSAAATLAHVVDDTEPGERGWHPSGIVDPTGFVGLACDELLIHTDDAARGLGRAFSAPEPVAIAVLDRLFPEAPGCRGPEDPEAWDVLRWANGRIDLPGHPRRSDWQRFLRATPPGAHYPNR